MTDPAASPSSHRPEVGNTRRSPSAAATDEPRVRLLIAGLFLIVSVSAFEITAVLTALPRIVEELDGEAYYGATLAAYLLATLVSVVASGELADRRGPGLPLAIGIAVFVTGLIVCGTAGSPLGVVIGRALQGFGAGAQSTLTYVIVRRAVPEHRHPRVYAIMSAGWVLPSLIAPLVAGWITDTFGWEWVFLGLIPLIGVVGVAVWLPVRRIPAPERTSARSRLPQACALAGGASAVVYASTSPSLVVGVILALAGGLVAAPAMRRLLPGGTFRARRGLPAAVAARLCATTAFGCVDSFVPLAANRIHRVDSAIKQGFVIIGAALTWTLGQAWAARSRTQDQTQRLVGSGFVLMALGAALTASVAFAVTPLWAVFAAWAIGGAGMGMLFNPTTVVALAGTTDDDVGLVSSQVNMADFIGFAVASTFGGALIALAERSGLLLRDALLITFAVAVAASVLGAVAVSRNVRVATPAAP